MEQGLDRLLSSLRRSGSHSRRFRLWHNSQTALSIEGKRVRKEGRPEALEMWKSKTIAIVVPPRIFSWKRLVSMTWSLQLIISLFSTSFVARLVSGWSTMWTAPMVCSLIRHIAARRNYWLSATMNKESVFIILRSNIKKSLKFNRFLNKHSRFIRKISSKFLRLSWLSFCSLLG